MHFFDYWSMLCDRASNHDFDLFTFAIIIYLPNRGNRFSSGGLLDIEYFTFFNKFIKEKGKSPMFRSRPEIYYLSL